MKIRLFCVLGACLLSMVQSQTNKCDLSGRKQDADFPDINKYVADSYIMGVEYSVPKAKQTDYFTEYYEDTFNRGRVESHIDGENKVYIYRSETWEAWNIQNDKCELENITNTPYFYKEAMTEWMHWAKGSKQPTTVGPSAMFKNAFDAWKNRDSKKMAFMGSFDGLIRGEKAIFWRRCINDVSYIDYFFADPEEENPYDSDLFDKVFTPVRVSFYNVSEERALADQFYDILSFQPYIPSGVEPFQLPKGKNCDRGINVEGPTRPDFSNNNLLLSAEVIYKKYSTKDGKELLSSYYSTLMFALDREINQLAYYYSSWNTTTPDKENKEPFVNAPHYTIYDMLHQYTYKIDYETSQCTISRDASFLPQYKLPENAGSLALTDPYVLFPNNEFKYLSEGTDRGLSVNIFEAEIKDFMLDKDTIIPRVIASHSFLKFNEEVENVAAVRNAPTQIELHFFRQDNIEEILTLNIFGFSTRLKDKQLIFDVTRCFKNDDDYVFFTIGFEIEPRYLKEIPKKLPEIEEEVLAIIPRKSELNPARIPTSMVDMKNDYVYVTMVILGKPPLQLDFPMEKTESGKSVVVSNPETDTQGISNFDTCANKCLEDINGCWGFSLCGTTCNFGSSTNTKVETKPDCTLFRRYTNSSYMPSKESQVNNLIGLVEEKEFNLVVAMDSGERITLTATLAEVTDPAEDDSLFEKMGNLLNPRMRVLKAGAKLKKGSQVKNMGRLRYDECQSLCLDFKDCETVSYCLSNAEKSECIISDKYGSDVKDADMEANNLCNLLTRKYTDHFERTPGVFVKVEGQTQVDATSVEDCARACLKYDSFKCLSFDHCAGGEKKGCTLYGVHFLNPNDRRPNEAKNARCGHYSRKYSNTFKRKDETRLIGSNVETIMNLTLEECAKTCVEYGQGTCYGYDFCQDSTLYATSCTLIDSDPSRLKSSYSPICTNYVRSEPEYAPRPYKNSYAGGIGFLCFLVGGVIGAAVVFIIAYIRVNRSS